MIKDSPNKENYHAAAHSIESLLCETRKRLERTLLLFIRIDEFYDYFISFYNRVLYFCQFVILIQLAPYRVKGH